MPTRSWAPMACVPGCKLCSYTDHRNHAGAAGDPQQRLKLTKLLKYHDCIDAQLPALQDLRDRSLSYTFKIALGAQHTQCFNLHIWSIQAVCFGDKDDPVLGQKLSHCEYSLRLPT